MPEDEPTHEENLHEAHEHGDSHVDDSIVIHDPEKAKEKADESIANAPHLPPAEELAEKSNTEGVGVAEMQSSREKHPFVN